MTAPFSKVLQANVPAVTIAADDDTVLGQADYDGTVTAVQYVPEAAITGAATDNRTVTLVNKGQAGSGTTVVATLAFANAVNATANNEKTIVLSATAANLLVAAGDTLVWSSAAVGTGLVDPGGVVRVSIARRDA